MIEIKLRKGEPVQRGLRRLKKSLEIEGTLKLVRERRHYEKPSEKKRRKMKEASFRAVFKIKKRGSFGVDK